MANPKHDEIVKRGAVAIAAWRNENPKVGFDLSRAKLSHVNLTGAKLEGADGFRPDDADD